MTRRQEGERGGSPGGGRLLYQRVLRSRSVYFLHPPPPTLQRGETEHLRQKYGSKNRAELSLTNGLQLLSFCSVAAGQNTNVPLMHTAAISDRPNPVHVACVCIYIVCPLSCVFLQTLQEKAHFIVKCYTHNLTPSSWKPCIVH